MKRTLLSFLLLACGLATLHADQTAGTALPAPTAYRVVKQSGNYNVWQRETYEQAADGTLITHVHKYTELASGLNYKSATGQWLPSKDNIVPYAQGAIAQQGPHKVIFANNLNSAGAIDMTTPDGKELKSNILGLMYHDTSSGNAVLIAETQDSQGELISANQILYPNAFNGVQASVRYQNKNGSFEQDVILNAQPPDPTIYGMNPATTEIEVMTEFTKSPQETITPGQVWKNGERDQNVSWGATRLGHGRAFMYGNSSKGTVPVIREYHNIQGRKVLLEKVHLIDIQPMLQNLPLQAGVDTGAGLPKTASKELVLPKAKLARATTKPMPMAYHEMPHQGFVLDYITLDATLDNFTFQSDTTYDVEQDVNLSDTTTFEGGTVIKFNTNSPAALNVLGSANFTSGSYSPAIFTSTSDNSVGEGVSASSSGGGAGGTEPLDISVYNQTAGGLQLYVQDDYGNILVNGVSLSDSGSTDCIFIAYAGQHYTFYTWDPSDGDANYVDLWPTGNEGTLYVNGWDNSYVDDGASLCSTPTAGLSLYNGGAIHNARFCNLAVAVNAVGNYSARDVVFANCGIGLQMQGSSFYAGNVLMSAVGTGFYGENYNGTVENLTYDQGTLLADDPSGSLTTSAIQLNNSLLTGVNGQGVVPVTTNYVASLSTNTGVYQVVGAGSYYLATGSPYHNAGTSNIDSTLLADLTVKTTYPPTVYSNTTISSSVTLNPTVSRDNTGIPDLGYHYDPLDYAFGDVDLSASLTFATNTAVGWFEADGNMTGIWLNDGASIVFQGSASQPCYFARYETVQEGGNGNWTDKGYLGGIVFNGDDPSSPPTLQGTFTKMSQCANDPNHFLDDWAYGQAAFTHSEFTSGNITSYAPSYYFTNCLLSRVYLAYWDYNDAASLAFQNCTFYNGGLAMDRYDGESPSFWNIQNTTFDGTSFIWSDNLNGDPGSTSFNYNAYNTANTNWINYWGGGESGTLEVVGAQDVMVTAGYNWQSSWFGNFYLPSGSPLIQAGGLPANQVGLYHFTTQVSQVPETNAIVDIGYHYVATDTSGNPLETLWFGVPDYLADTNGELAAWEMNYFGFIGLNPTNLDANDNTLLYDYQNGLDPNIITFTVAVTNNYVSTNTLKLGLNITFGSPGYYAVSLDDTNFVTDAVWQAYTGTNLMANVSTNQGWHELWIGLKGPATDASVAWQRKHLKLDYTPPTLIVTNPVVTGGAANVNLPLAQIQGYCPEALSSITYDLSNAVTMSSNQLVEILGEDYSTNTCEFTTNYFQAYDVLLINGVNLLTIHAADLAGNTTNFSYELDYTPKTNAPVVQLLWPQNGLEICGTNIVCRGIVDDSSAKVTIQLLNTNGTTNTIISPVGRDGIFYSGNLSLTAGTNYLTYTVTDSSGLITTTNITVSTSDLGLTLDTVVAGQALITGTIDDDSYTVYVNGVIATNDGFGNWSTIITPIGVGGGAVVVNAVFSGGDPTLQQIVQPPEGTFVSEYHESEQDNYFWGTMALQLGHTTMNFGDGGGGNFHQLIFEDYDPPGGYTMYDIDWPATTWPEPLTNGIYYYTSWNVDGAPPETSTNDYGTPYLPWEHCDITLDDEWIYDSDDESMTGYRTADTKIKLATGGPAASTLQNLWRISATATDMTTGLPIPSQNITVMGQPLNSSGYIYKVLPDNTQPDVTPTVSGADNYTFGVSAEKYCSYFYVCVLQPHPGDTIEGLDDTTGHAFYGLITEAPNDALNYLSPDLEYFVDGFWGFYPTGDGFYGDPGHLASDNDHPYSVQRVFYIGYPDMINALIYSRQIYNSPPNYNVFTFDCITCTINAGSMAGIKLPIQLTPQDFGAAILEWWPGPLIDDDPILP